MARLETTLPNPIPGAGRMLDMIWPSPLDFVLSAPAMFRINPAAFGSAIGPTFASGGGGGVDSLQIVNGVLSYNVACNAAVGSFHATLLPQKVYFNTTKNFPDGLVDDLHCWRIIFIAAIFAVPAVTGEMGLYLATNTNNVRVVNDTSSGFGFRFLNDGSVVFMTIQGVAPTNTTLVTVAGGFDVTQFHAYELRIFGATATQEAHLQVLIDSASKTSLLPATSQSWAAGSLLPIVPVVNPVAGFTPDVCCMGNNANAIRINQVRVMAGPTPDSVF
jgi:hypothetical protein